MQKEQSYNSNNLLQRYGDFGLIPRNLPDSCRSCCDKGKDLRQSWEEWVGLCRKRHKKGAPKSPNHKFKT